MTVDALRSEVFRRFPHRCSMEAQQLTGWVPSKCAICRWVLDKMTGVNIKW